MGPNGALTADMESLGFDFITQFWALFFTGKTTLGVLSFLLSAFLAIRAIAELNSRRWRWIALIGLPLLVPIWLAQHWYGMY